MLAQWHNGKLRPVKFLSHSFTTVEGHWPPTHQKLFAVKQWLEHFRPYLLGRKLTVITDHVNLQWLTSISPQQSKRAQWCLSMAEFGFKIEHHAGSANVIPDVLSCTPLTHSFTTGDYLFLPHSLSLVSLPPSWVLISPILTPLVFQNFLVMPLPASPLHPTLSPFNALQHVPNPTLPRSRASLPLHLPLL